MAEKSRLWTKGFILDTLVNFLIYIIYYMLMVIIASEAIHSLNATMSEAGLASGIFILGTLLARLFAGRSVELYGRKKMLYAGILFYLATTFMYFAIHSLPMLFLVRCLNGIGYGIASTATSTIVSTMIPAARRGEGINYYALSMSLAAAIGPFIGMLMQQIFPFEDIIYFCIGMIVVCLGAVAVMHVDEMELTEEHRAELKEIHIANFLEPKVTAISIVAFCVAVCYSSVLSFLASYAAELQLMAAGTLFFVVYALAITIARPIAGVMFDRKGEDFVMYPTYACLAIGLLLLSITTQSWMMLLAGVFVGLGYGTFMSNGQAICVKLVKEVRIGVAVSTYFIALDLGLGVGPYMLGAFKESLGFQGIYFFVGIAAIGCAALYYVLYARRRNAGHLVAADAEEAAVEEVEEEEFA
ncbi:MFS transporter [uncultured Mitsuokella sp.]|uniref:MFS transporter n=1 Tax=uncultured Mitsuokella sp. TaxID=453120 RepID=UPI002626F083|nr:MFS transporter [uncultured Mitsuokella sp.]